MTSPNVTVNRKSKLKPWGMGSLVVTALVLCLGPVLMVVGTLQINADEDLVRTGEQVPGTITEFHDRSKASDRRMKVEFQSSGGSLHYEWIAVDYEQHPVVGEEVTVAYRESDPGHATVLGYESDGVFLRGVGTVLTCIFGGIGIFLVICYLLGVRQDRKKLDEQRNEGRHGVRLK
ncbi:DUF3592 domain-containing protein [Arthrobacter sp. NPDC058288]|uniref:DUF3592 domain-containing protein n=1 Tax=Arthrobacter sp. NPDC058288 TaxID=3346424 RepID=UPI0036ED5AF7